MHADRDSILIVLINDSAIKKSMVQMFLHPMYHGKYGTKNIQFEEYPAVPVLLIKIIL